MANKTNALLSPGSKYSKRSKGKDSIGISGGQRSRLTAFYLTYGT